MTRKYLSGCEYYLTFIDDYSRNTWIYFLKTKSEVLKWFQEFRALVENQSGKRIKVSWSNNGEEYSSRQFVDFCSQDGIIRQMTVPYNPPTERGIQEKEPGYHRCNEIHVARSKFSFVLMGRGECYCSLPAEQEPPHDIGEDDS
jgi:transposase InsO family protein